MNTSLKLLTLWSRRPAQQPVTIIEARRGWFHLDLKSLWEYRELLYFILWRDIKGNYRQMALGPLWIVLKPVLSMLIFSAVFGGLVKTPADGLPYPIFFYSALLPWTLFSGALQTAAGSLTSNMKLISKVYFPRLIVPIAGALAGLVDFAVSFVLLVALTLYYGFRPGPAVLTLPFFLALTLLTALAMGLWVASLSVRFRDVGIVLGYFTQAWMYASPVVYASSAVPERWRALYDLNPMTQVIDGFRWALLGKGPGPGLALALSTTLVLFLLLTGVWHFQRTERTVVDIL
jgi:homopolymeric O-antigen transport system permease protein